MPCHTRMKSTFLQGLLWLFLLQLGFMAVSLEPGYLDFDNLPDTNFSCIGRVVGGYYADTATSCQMFHVCTLGQNNETMDIRFLCLNGTVFEQSTRVCERIDEVDCDKSEHYYHLNNELYGGMDPLIIRGESESPDSATTPSTTTTTAAVTPTTANPYFVTPKQTTARQQISSIYASDSPSDIRFDPKIINLQLNSDPSLGANIKPVSYQQQSYNDDKNHHTIVTTHSYKNDFKGQSLKPTDVNYEFEYQDQEQYNPNNRKNYQVANLPAGYSPSAAELEDYGEDVFKGSTYRTVYPVPKIVHQGDSSTYKTPITFAPSSNPQSQYSFERTDVPVKHQVQQQQPHAQVTPSPITIFSALSSPAPFSHPHHLETKRNTDHHKIKKSFSLSISDQNGKELITVKNTPIDEVTFLPIFEDVPRLHKRRPKREIEKKIFKADPEAADALRFLADWYTKYEKTTKLSSPLTSEDITEINDVLSTSEEEDSDEQESKEVVSDEKVPESQEEPDENETRPKEELDGKEQESKEKSGEGEEDFKNDISDSQIKENEYYYDDDDYYYDDIVEVDKKPVPNITVSHIELEEQSEANKNETNLNTPKDNIKESNKSSISKDSQETKSYLEEYVDDNYEPHTYQKNNSTLEEKEVQKKAELDINETSKDATIAPDVLYEYIDDNYEPTVKVHNNSEEIEGDIGNETLGVVLTNASTVVTLPTTATTTKLPTTTEAEVNDIITTDPIHSSTEETTIFITTDYNIVKNVVDADENVLQTNTSENQTIDSQIDAGNESHNETLEDIVTEYVTDSNNLDEELHFTTLPSITVDLPSSTTEDIPNITTLYYSTQLSTEQTTASISTELSSTTSTTTHKPDNIEVPITTSSYIPELLETITESAYVISKITSTTMQTPLVTEKLNVMIKDIEVETKSIAATIVMPEANGKIPPSTPKLENSVTEYVEELTTTQMPTVEATVTTTTQVPTSIITPKLWETTKRPYYVRGRHNYFSRKPIISTTTTRSTHRFGLQHRRRFDVRAERPTIFKEKKTINSSVNDVHKDEISNITIKETTSEIYKNISSTENVTNTEVPIQNDHQDLAPLPKSIEETITDASLSKSANPTLAKETKYFLATTPISKHVRVKFKKERVNKKYVFTCFNRKINKFYSDPRDCRLFHYCSQGYTSKQLVDMKFVCDLGTYFDDAKLICTEKKPARCL